MHEELVDLLLEAAVPDLPVGQLCIAGAPWRQISSPLLASVLYLIVFHRQHVLLEKAELCVDFYQGGISMPTFCRLFLCLEFELLY